MLLIYAPFRVISRLSTEALAKVDISRFKICGLILMNKTIQQCDSCLATGAADKTWTRIFGAYAGAPNQYIPQQTFPPRPQAPMPANAVAPKVIDLCPACAAKITVAELITLTTPKA